MASIRARFCHSQQPAAPATWTLWPVVALSCQGRVFVSLVLGTGMMAGGNAEAGTGMKAGAGAVQRRSLRLAAGST